MVIMETPCQKIVWDLVPAIRASLAIELVKKRTVTGSVGKVAGDCPVGSFPVYIGKTRLQN